MTPFGFYLRSLRALKGVSLTSLASSLNISSPYLSALEHGRKGIPNDHFISNIVEILQLNTEQEQELLWHAKNSSRHLKLDSNARPALYNVLHELVRKGNNLTDKQLEIISCVAKD